MFSARLVGLAVTLVFLPGCASLISGTQKTVRVTSDPAGALVKVDGATRALTPGRVNVWPKSNHEIVVAKPGFERASFRAEQHLDAWIFANVLNGFLPGMLVDWATGAMYRVEPTAVHVQLERLGGRARR